jgi:hypothetical protein
VPHQERRCSRSLRASRVWSCQLRKRASCSWRIVLPIHNRESYKFPAWFSAYFSASHIHFLCCFFSDIVSTFCTLMPYIYIYIYMCPLLSPQVFSGGESGRERRRGWGWGPVGDRSAPPTHTAHTAAQPVSLKRRNLRVSHKQQPHLCQTTLDSVPASLLQRGHHRAGRVSAGISRRQNPRAMWSGVAISPRV